MRALVVGLLLLASPAVAQDGNVWVLPSSNPLFANYPEENVPTNVPPIDQDHPFRIWNDPSVMKEGSTYKMWATLDRTAAAEGVPAYYDVSIYYLESTDGYTWEVKTAATPSSHRGPTAASRMPHSTVAVSRHRP